MAVKGKLWGTTEPVLITPFFELHRIKVAGFGQSSWHHHAHKWNAFTLLSGSIWIETRYPGTKKVESLELVHPGDTTTVAPGVIHRFVSYDTAGARVLELYYPEGLSEDIVRYSIGGTQ